MIDLCRKAREQLQSQADEPFRLCVLLDMVLLELGKELALIGDDQTA